MLSTFTSVRGKSRSDPGGSRGHQAARVDAKLVYLSIDLALSQIIEIIAVEQRLFPEQQTRGIRAW